MRSLTPATLKGTWSTLLLPLGENEEIQWEGIDRQLTALAKAQVSGIYFNGTAGEFFNQSNEEFIRLAKTTATFCEAKQIPFQIGASHAHPNETLNRIEQTRELKPGAFQVILPEWNPLNWEEIVNYLRRLIALADPIPLVIYNPPNALKVLHPSEWQRLVSEVDGIIGIKVAGGDAVWHAEMRPLNERLSVFVAGIRLASGMIRGVASGSYSNLACLAPSGAVRWGQTILKNTDKALAQEDQILDVFKTALDPVRGRYSNTAIDKALAAAGGWAGGNSSVRWPLASIPPADVQSLSMAFREGLPFLFDEPASANYAIDLHSSD